MSWLTGYYVCLAVPIKGSVPFICHMKKLEQRFSMLAKRPESSNPASGKEGIASLVIICTANGMEPTRRAEVRGINVKKEKRKEIEKLKKLALITCRIFPVWY